MHRERVLKALAQLLVGVENKLHLADRRRRREDKLIERARLLEIQRAQNKTNIRIMQIRQLLSHGKAKRKTYCSPC